MKPFADDPVRRGVVPSPRVVGDRFAPRVVDPYQAAAEARHRGVLVWSDFAEQLWQSDESPVRLRMPLRRGHLALLIAAGLLNNCVLREGDRSAPMKARTFKDLVSFEGDDADVEIQREVIRTLITVLDLVPGDIEAIEQGSEEAPKPAGRVA